MRKINDAGLALIKRFEGLRLEAYRCPAGVLTIGYGSTGLHVKQGMVITEALADEFLRNDVRRFEQGVEVLTENVPTNDNQFSALVSLAFNVGLANVATSTLIKKHRARDYAAAADQFLRWNRAGGRVLGGLTRRREAERELYLA